MALAKYREDIEDRYYEDTSQRFEALFALRDFEKEWRQAAHTESAAVAAKMSGGSFFEDRMAFMRHEQVSFLVVSSPEAKGISVRYEPAGKPSQPVHPSAAAGTYKLPPPHEDGRLELRCGHYTKTYEIAFLDEKNPEGIPDLRASLAAIASNPARWTKQSFEKVRQDLDKSLAVQGVPPDFAYGVKEFYLGLFHESLGEPNFRKRIETAFTYLRPFCSHSKYAALISAYYLYRVNSFDRVATLSQMPGLSRVARFFSNSYGVETRRRSQNTTRAKKIAATEILISDRDFAMFQAVDCLAAHNLTECADHLNQASCSVKPGIDPQGDERFLLIQARLAHASGSLSEARSHYANLTFSPMDNFRTEAEKALTTLDGKK